MLIRTLGLCLIEFICFIISIALCGTKNCTKHSTCIDNKCVCDKGFHGNGFIKCERKYKGLTSLQKDILQANVC